MVKSDKQDEADPFKAGKPSGGNIRDTKELPSILRYEAAFLGAPIGMLFATRKGEILDVNPAFKDMTGLSLEEIAGKTIITALKDFGDQNALSRLRSYLSRESSDQHIAPFELEHNGRVFEVTFPRLQDLDPSIKGVTAMFRDVTEQKKAEEDLKRSEEKERTLRRVTPNIHYLISPEGIDGEILDINDSVDILGYTPEELIGKPLSTIIHPEEIERISREFVLPSLAGKKIEEQGGEHPKLSDERRTAERRTLNLETRLVTKDGRIIPVMINATGLYEGSKFLGTYGVVTDISELKQAEEDLRRKEEFNSALFEYNPIETIVVDHEGRIVQYNLAKRESGRRLPNIGDVMYKDYAAKHKIDMYSELMQCIRSGKSKSFPELVYEDETLSLSIAPFPEGAIITLQDITERKRLEEQLQIRQRMDAIGTLAGGFAHDFNNLLAAILGNISLIDSGHGLNDTQRKYIDYAREGCEKAASLVDKIRIISSQEHVPKKTSVDLYEIASSVFGLLENTTDRIIDKKNELKPKEYYVVADESGLHQVLLNIGTNAVWAIERRGVKAGDYIRIRAEEYAIKGKGITGLPDGEYVHIFFEDNGIGMTEEVRKRAFEHLFTTKKRTTQKGQGLGLAMVYNIVTKNYKGHINIESEEGKGTTFHIYLPKAQPSENVKKEITGVVGGDETVLVVDDEENVIRLVNDMLTPYGYRVITASDGKQGLETYIANKDSIDVVLLDLVMPRMSGQTMFEEMLKINPDVKVIICSGQISEEQTHEGVLSNAKGYVHKPYNIRQMAQTVRTVLDL